MAPFLGRWKSGRTWKRPEDTTKAALRVVSRPGARATWQQRLDERAARDADRRLLADIRARKQEARDAKRAHFEAARARAAARAAPAGRPGRARGRKNKLRV